MSVVLPADEAARLAALEHLALLDTPAEERFDRVTRLCRRVFGVPVAAVNLLSSDRCFAKSIDGASFGDVPRAQAFCARTVLHDALVVLEDTAADEELGTLPAVRELGLRFYAGAPLHAAGQPVGTLCLFDHEPRTFGEEQRELLQDLAAWVEHELSVGEELDRAGEVQRSLLPERPPTDRAWELAGACRTSRSVGGDFYDWQRTPAGIVVALGDVMGKGLPAAIVMASLRAALRTGTRRADLAEGVEAVAWSLATDLEAISTFATLALCRLEADGHVTVVDAGHGHLAVIGAEGQVQVPEHGGLPLGIDPGEQYVAQHMTLRPGELLLVHSDGLLELPEGPRTTEEAAALVAGAPSAQAAVDALTAIDADVQPPDDVTVVAIRRAA